MNKISYLKLILTTMFIYSFVSSCTSQSKDPDKKKIQDANQTIEEKKGQFNPGFQNNPQSTHIAVKVNHENGVFQLANQTFRTRPGKLPYSKNGGGDFIVEIKDAGNQLIGRYFTQNPTTIRVCDEGQPPAIKVISKGSFNLLLPSDQRINSVNFISEGKSIATLNIPVSRLIDSTRGSTRTDTIQRPE